MNGPLHVHDAALERLKALHPKLIDLSLTRVARLLEALGRPQDRLPPVVHVAGTNGKGSTVAFLRSIAEQAGLKTHVFTSPHLVRFAERIRLGGRLIDDDALAAVLERAEAANAGLPITFFEITTAAALLAFSEAPADLCLIEVGLGGRFDATNVIDAPAVSVITPVAFDHQDFLGSDLRRIAWEKAGVVKAGRPVVAARQAPEALEAIEEEAERLLAPLSLCGRDFDASEEAGSLIFRDPLRRLTLPPPSLFGPHQYANAGLAVAAALALDHPRIGEGALRAGVAAAVWPARLQRLTSGPLAEWATKRGSDLWLDGGHNPHAAQALAAAAAQLRAQDGRPLVFVIGLLRRKDADGVLNAVAGLGGRVVVTGFAAEGAAAPSALLSLALSQGLDAAAAPDPASAVRLALKGEGPAPHVLIFGSLHLAGEVLALSPDTWPT